MSDPTQTTSGNSWYEGLFNLGGQYLNQEFQLDALELQGQLQNTGINGASAPAPVIVRETTSGGSQGTITPQLSTSNFGGMTTILLVGGAVLAAVFIAKG